MSRGRPLHGFGGSGSDSLNFKIIAYDTEEELLAATPKENTIGVIPGTKLTSWIFDSSEPSDPTEGMLWIRTGTASVVPFNALKKNGIAIYPISAAQYISGAWADVTCKSRQNTGENLEWVDWWNGELYVDGNQFESITGGWWNNTELTYATTNSYPNSGQSLEFGEYITVYAPSNTSTNATTKNKIDLTKWTELTYEIADDSSSHNPTVVIHNIESGALKSSVYAASSNNGVIDVSALSGEYYISVLSANARTMKVGNIRLA